MAEGTRGDSNFCPKCGNATSPDDVYCRKCGASVSGAQTSKPEPTMVPDKVEVTVKRTEPLWSQCCSVTCLIILIIVIMFMLGLCSLPSVLQNAF